MPTLQREGATIAYEVRGAGDAVLLCQGAGVAGCGWRPQVEALADFRTITFDNRGFGGSKPAAKRASIEDLAADALAVLDAVGVERAHVVGHSMGGLVAQALALAAPTRVRSLALLCTVDRGPAASRPSLGVLATSMNAMIGSAARRRRVWLGLVIPEAELAVADRDALAAELGALFGRDLASQPPAVFDQVLAMGAFDRSAELSRLGSIPTLVVSGELDRITPAASGRALAAAIPGAKYVELLGAGHALVAHGPNVAKVNALLREHLATAR